MMTVRESIHNEIYALEDAKRSMEDLLAKLTSQLVDGDDYDDFDPYYDGHIFYDTRDHIAALRNVVIPGLTTLIDSNRGDLQTFPETILCMELLPMRRVN